MLIKALCDYYDLQSEQSPSDLPEGYSKQAIHYLVRLKENGEIGAIDDCREEVEIPQKNGKTKVKKVPREIALPERPQTTKVFSAVVEHRPLYLFGLNYENGILTPDDKTDKARKSHADFAAKNSEFFADLTSPVCTAYRNFIRNWDPEKETENEELKKLGKDYSGAYFSFALYDDISKTPQNDPGFIEKYRRSLIKEDKPEDGYTAICPIEGKRLPVARIHDKIKFPGGNTTGCVLVGMKESAYESFCKTQSYNSNISETAMKKYSAAFNSLLADNNHRAFINSMVIVFFALKKDDSAETDIFSALFGDTRTEETNNAVSKIMKNLKSGRSADLSDLDIDAGVEFIVAGFTPNAARICQKFFVRSSFGKIMENAISHQRDLIVSESSRQITFSMIARELISPNSTKEEIPPPLMSGIIRAAFEGANYPEAMLQTAIMRVKTDHNDDKNKFVKFNDTRIGIIKACLNRKARKANKKEEITMSLNKDNTNAAYLCGRLFAVLEKLQQEAAGGQLNTTISDSYFSSACSKPSSVFPKLVELSVHHIKKLGNDGGKIFYKTLMGDIIDKLKDEIPATFNLDDQGRFIVGYFQQNRALWTKKDDTEEEN